MNSTKILREYIRIILEARKNIPDFPQDSKLAQALDTIIASEKQKEHDFFETRSELIKSLSSTEGYQKIGVDPTSEAEVNPLFQKIREYEGYLKNLEDSEAALNTVPETNVVKKERLQNVINNNKEKIEQMKPDVEKARETLRTSGSSRIVFVGEHHVIKVAANEKGLDQNTAEIDAYEKLSDEQKELLTKPFHSKEKFNDKYIWIAAEKAVPLKSEEQFEKFMGMPLKAFQYFVCETEEKINNLFKRYENEKDRFEELESYQTIAKPWRKLIADLNYACRDTTKLESFGTVIDDDGETRLVIFDYGLTRSAN